MVDTVQLRARRSNSYKSQRNVTYRLYAESPREADAACRRPRDIKKAENTLLPMLLCVKMPSRLQINKLRFFFSFFHFFLEN